jgi:hypothetical protein
VGFLPVLPHKNNVITVFSVSFNLRKERVAQIGEIRKNFLNIFPKVLDISLNPCYAKPCVTVNGGPGGL